MEIGDYVRHIHAPNHITAVGVGRVVGEQKLTNHQVMVNVVWANGEATTVATVWLVASSEREFAVAQAAHALGVQP